MSMPTKLWVAQELDGSFKVHEKEPFDATQYTLFYNEDRVESVVDVEEDDVDPTDI